MYFHITEFEPIKYLCRYMYFPCSRKQFGLPGPSLLEVGHDEREQDGMLASALTVGFALSKVVVYRLFVSLINM